MFEGFKNKMTQFYDDVKNKMRPEENQPEEGPIIKQKVEKPIIRKVVKPTDFGMNNSLVNSQLNESDLDMKRLDNFHLTFNSEKSIDDHGARRVMYYKQETSQRSGVLGSIKGFSIFSVYGQWSTKKFDRLGNFFLNLFSSDQVIFVVPTF